MRTDAYITDSSCSLPAAACVAFLAALTQPAHGADAESLPDSASSSVSQAFPDTGAASGLAELFAAGATIGTVSIETGSIFDLEDPREDRFLFRLANRAHMTTKPEVVEQMLLFEPGTAYSTQLLEESERILREKRYIQEATVEPVSVVDGVVDVRVSTRDTWSLTPRISFSHTGGVSSTGLGVKERNLFGSGAAVELMFKSDVDRDSMIFAYDDPNLGDSWRSLNLLFQDSSDGYTRAVDFGKPFHALDSKHAFGISLFQDERIEPLYDRGENIAEFGQSRQRYEVSMGNSAGLVGGWARRVSWGLGFDEKESYQVPDSLMPSQYLPEDYRLVYPFVGFELVQDKYEETTNVDQIARVEDRFVGSALTARLGVADPIFGADRQALLLDAVAQTSFLPSEKVSLFLTTGLTSRVESDGPVDTVLSFDAQYYRRQSDVRLLFAKVSGSVGTNLDLDQKLFLGGDNGLRGYPLRYQSGERRALVTLEQRFYTDWYPFRLFRVGAAAFVDAGRTWGEGAFGPATDGWLTGAGVGLRLGNPRSSLGKVIHIDVAFPLSGDYMSGGPQLVIETKTSF